MSSMMQVALLRTLETKEFRPLGSAHVHFADFRLLSAAFPDLEERMRRGEFREDLYYRISAFRLYIPPLRARQEDIEYLAGHYARAIGMRLTRAAVNRMCELPWRGNVREFRARGKHN